MNRFYFSSDGQCGGWDRVYLFTHTYGVGVWIGFTSVLRRTGLIFCFVLPLSSDVRGWGLDRIYLCPQTYEVDVLFYLFPQMYGVGVWIGFIYVLRRTGLRSE